MNNKLVFFDLDGTLCDIEKGIAESTKSAIKRLKERGHKAFICTGRSRAFIPEEAIQIGFDGIVAACGAYLELNGYCLINSELPTGIAKKSVEILRKHHMVPVMEGKEYMYYDKNEYTTAVDWYSDLITQQLGEHWRPIKGFENVMHINKISAKKLADCNDKSACEELSPYYDFIEHEGSFVGTTIEYIVKGASKADGIKRIIKVMGRSQEDTVAFGDSNNDLSMFTYVKQKIAMGNGSNALKEKADYITGSMEEDGIQSGLEFLQLI